ncbi:MAG: hypothetical protein IT375_29570 [Polyangiaceae bacterium]|nr:hypothetical protein [Polyangiaceae bacterium]
MNRRAARCLPFVPLLGALAGCDGCGKSKPYTPFTIASGAAESAAAPSAAEVEADAATPPAKFVVRAALPAPARATAWSFDGRELAAPAGRMFERALAADFDGDGAREVVAWTLPAAASPPSASGELWLFPARGAPKKLLDLPGFVPTGPSCSHGASLLQTGPKSVTLDVTAQCTTTLLARAPTRSVSVVAPLSERPELGTWRVAAPATGEPFSVDVDSVDRDGDGRDDVRLVVTARPICRAPAPATGPCPTDKDDKSASAQVIWLDRPAGLSRDATEPAQSLGAAAAAELARSKRKQSAPQVARGVAQLRRLMGVLCAEGASARILEGDGSMLRCAPLAAVVERLLVAEVQALLAEGDATRAMAALERDGWYFGRAPEKRHAELEKSVLGAVTLVEAKEVPPAKVEVTPRGAAPRMSPLAFEPSGSLLVQSKAGLRRVTEAGEVEALDADAGVTAWPLGVDVSVVFSCERSDVHLSGNPLEPPSGLLSPRPGACAGGKAPSPSIAVLGAKDGRTALLVAGEPLGLRITRAEAVLRPRVFGSPRSPDGRLLVLPMAAGLWLEGGDKPELWRTADAQALAECTVSDGAKSVACVAGSAVRIFRR